MDCSKYWTHWEKSSWWLTEGVSSLINHFMSFTFWFYIWYCPESSVSCPCISWFLRCSRHSANIYKSNWFDYLIFNSLKFRVVPLWDLLVWKVPYLCATWSSSALIKHHSSIHFFSIDWELTICRHYTKFSVFCEE